MMSRSVTDLITIECKSNSSRRSDVGIGILPAAAVNAVSSSLTPITIFSNLLNAYATIDSKHDITEKLINTATSLLGGGDDSGEDKDKEKSLKTTTSSTRDHHCPELWTYFYSIKVAERALEAVSIQVKGILQLNESPEFIAVTVHRKIRLSTTQRARSRTTKPTDDTSRLTNILMQLPEAALSKSDKTGALASSLDHIFRYMFH